MKNTERINKQYEQKHLRNIKAYQKRLQDYYEKAIDQIFAKANTSKLVNNTFSITQHPVLKNLVDKVLLELKGNVETLIINGVDTEWEFAEAKTDAIISDHLSKKQISEAAKDALFTRRQAALVAFKNRKSQGLNLSDRVWNYTNQFRGEIEQGLYVGISEGKSAVAMASDQKKYLKDPDKLFRRVRDAKGNLKLSKAAKEFKPGKGVYRSSFKNALRLTRTETNMSYRNSDNDRYSRTKFILGIEVKLSANHPVYDICDHLAGKYPPAFKFQGWHPQCLCFTVPVLPSLAEYDKYEDAILAGTEDKFQFSNPINNVPANFTKYIQDNKEMLNRLKSTPYFIRDNFKGGNIQNGLKFKVVENIPKKANNLIHDFTPKNLNEYLSRDKTVVDKEIFQLLKKETSLTLDNSKGSYYLPDQETVNLSYKTIQGGTWKPKSIVYHEFGHAIDWQNGIKNMPEVKSIMDKYRAEFSKNNNERYKSIDKLLWNKGNTAYQNNKFDEMYQTSAAHDTLMSLNSNFGAGHSKAYFANKGMSEAEFIAHMFENKYAGNAIFKEVMPDLYEESIAILTDIVNKIKSK